MKNTPITQLIHTWYQKALKHSKYRWLVIAATLFYLANPLDLSPDFIPVLGWIDDGLIASLLVAEVSQLMTTSLKRKQNIAQTMPTEVETVIDPDGVTTVNVEAVQVG